MESTDSSAGSPRRHQPNLPPGFRFHPTDEELVVHYLKKKASSAPLPVAIIAEVDLYKFDPWELPAKATFGEQEWYFFSPRDRKYPNGARPNRAATSGYWKATGTDKPVLSSGGTQKVGVKKALVFYGGKPPKGIKTNWIMHEYRLADNKAHNRPPGCHDPASKKNSLRLDDWVLCRIYKKSNASRPLDHHHHDHDHHDPIIVDDILGGGVGPIGTHVITPMSMMSVMAGQVGPQGINDHHLFDGILSSAATANPLPASSPSGPAKRAALPGAYWNADVDDAGPSKRLIMPMDHRHGGGASGGADQFGAAEAENNNVDVNGCHAAAAASSSLATLLSQLPAAAQTPGAAVLGAMGADGGLFQRPFPLPGMNWYSN